jgi:RecA-family ATPase
MTEPSWRMRKAVEASFNKNPEAFDGKKPASGEVIPVIKNLYPGKLLMNMHFEPRAELVEGMFREKETTLFVGKAKLGKSLLLQQMTICLCHGVDFLGMKTKKSRVLYIDLENEPDVFQKRMKEMFPELCMTDAMTVYCPENISKSEVSLVDKAKLKNFHHMIQLSKPDVVIIDPLRLMIGGDENKAGDVLGSLKSLASIRDDWPKLCIIIVHHTRKDSLDTPAT